MNMETKLTHYPVLDRLATWTGTGLMIWRFPPLMLQMIMDPKVV